MTETEAREEYAKYLRCIERGKQKALCKTCGDTGFTPVLKRKNGLGFYVALSPCECLSLYASERAIDDSGNGETIRVKSFDNFETKATYQAKMKALAMGYVDEIEKSHWFTVCGQSGCGKTHICTAIMGELLKKGKRVKYMRWLDEMRKIKADLNNIDVLEEYKQCQVLYIDDLFKGKISDYDFNITFELINYRYSRRMVTIISTERQPEELQQIDEALYSRIKEMAGRYILIIECDSSKNMRLCGGEEK